MSVCVRVYSCNPQTGTYLSVRVTQLNITGPDSKGAWLCGGDKHISVRGKVLLML